MSKIKQFLGSYKKPTGKLVEELTSDEINHYNEPLLTWTAASFIKFERTKVWYIFSAVLLAIVVLFAVLLGSPTFAVAVVVFAMVYIFLTQDDPEPVQVVISDIGIVFGNKVYPFTDIKTFWIEYEPPAFQSLHLVLKNEFTQDITINFHGLNPTLIRSTLVSYLPEWEERQKSFTENLTRMLGL